MDKAENQWQWYANLNGQEHKNMKYEYSFIKKTEQRVVYKCHFRKIIIASFHSSFIFLAIFSISTLVYRLIGKKIGLEDWAR